MKILEHRGLTWKNKPEVSDETIDDSAESVADESIEDPAEKEADNEEEK